MNSLSRVPRVAKEPASCGIYGALAVRGGRGFVNATQGLCAIEEIRKARGGSMGNGIFLAHPNITEQNGSYNLMVWARDESLIRKAEAVLRQNPNVRFTASFQKLCNDEGKGIWQLYVDGDDLQILRSVLLINGNFVPEDLRVISSSKHGLLIKDTEPLSELFGRYSLDGLKALALLAHTRYPTGANTLPTRAHPHSFGNITMVVNGDVKSYVANLRATEFMISEVLYPLFGNDADLESFMRTVRRSWVGSDAEVVAVPFYLMRQQAVSVHSAIRALVPPFDNAVATLPAGEERSRLRSLLADTEGLQLDGPVAAILTVTTDNDVRMVAFRDRSEYRPLQVLYDRASKTVHIGSELRQLERASGKDARDESVESYSLEPGRFFMASYRRGIMEWGRTRRTAIVVPGPPEPTDLVRVIRSKGEPHLLTGAKLKPEERIVIDGPLGNCGLNYSIGDGTVEALSSVQDNVFEASRVKEILTHGNAGIVYANAFQGEWNYIRGSADARAFMQIRHSQRQKPPPVGIIGERAGVHLAKMDAGGIVMVLGIGELGHEEDASPLVGPYAATGMMAGIVYVRGIVPRHYIGKPPSARRMIGELRELRNRGLITAPEHAELSANMLDLGVIERILEHNPDVLGRLSSLFSSKHQKAFDVQFRALDESEHLFLDPHLERFCERFNLEPWIVDALKSSAYTVIKLKEEKTEEKVSDAA